MWLDWINGVALLLWSLWCSLASFCGPSPRFLALFAAAVGFCESTQRSLALSLALWCSLALLSGVISWAYTALFGRLWRSLMFFGALWPSGVWRAYTVFSGALWRSLARSGGLMWAYTVLLALEV